MPVGVQLAAVPGAPGLAVKIVALVMVLKSEVVRENDPSVPLIKLEMVLFMITKGWDVEVR